MRASADGDANGHDEAAFGHATCRIGGADATGEDTLTGAPSE
ncbi:MAG: hypothetical protein ABI629_00225 [bacterium]